MTAGNFEDKRASLNTILRNEYRERQQDCGEETQIHLPYDGRNFEDKTKRAAEHSFFTE